MRKYLDRLVASSSFLAIIFSVFYVGVTQATDEGLGPSFPRLAGIQIGTASPLDAERLQAISRLDVVIVPGWRTFKTPDGYDIETLPEAIKALNPNIKVFPYTNPPDMYHTDSTWAFPRQKIESEKSLNGNYSDWWLRTGNGEKLLGPVSSRYRVNLTPAVSRDANGLIWPEWFARYLNAAPTDAGDWVQTSGKGYRQGKWDGTFVDNVWVTKYYGITADWNDDGSDNSRDDALTKNLVIDGHLAYVDEWRRLQPGRNVIANLSSLVDKATQPLDQRMYGVYDGGVLEWVTRAEHWGGWNQMMADYRLGMDMSQGPKIVLFHHSLRMTRDRYPDSSFSDYRWNRYFLASCLMHDGYYVSSYNYHSTEWFDEFDIDLGYPVDPPQSSEWMNGVYKREFENGLVLVNPKGNGTQTVNIGAGWRRFVGVEDPVHNDGTPAMEITLEAQDGIILIRDGTEARPRSPALRVE